MSDIELKSQRETEDTPPLEASERIARCLLSTPAQFVGHYSTKYLRIDHAWPNFRKRQALYMNSPSPLTRTTIVASFPTPLLDKRPGMVVPDYTWVGDYLVVIMSVLFGKRFDNHGVFEGNGLFGRPDFYQMTEVVEHDTPQCESKPRVDLGIDLNFSHLSKIQPILDGKESDALETFMQAGTFYAAALQEVDRQGDKAYLDLVTAGEVLSQYFDFNDHELFDDDIISLLKEIRETLHHGEKKERIVRKRLFQVKRRFILSLRQLLNADFFTVSESMSEWNQLDSAMLERCLGAAYDLRSQRVHAGHRFGHWVTGGNRRAERQHGSPVVHNKQHQKAIARAPTFTGLERIIRYALLAFLHREIHPFDQRLDPDPPKGSDEAAASTLSGGRD